MADNQQFQEGWSCDAGCLSGPSQYNTDKTYELLAWDTVTNIGSDGCLLYQEMMVPAHNRRKHSEKQYQMDLSNMSLACFLLEFSRSELVSMTMQSFLAIAAICSPIRPADFDCCGKRQQSKTLRSCTHAVLRSQNNVKHCLGSQLTPERLAAEQMQVVQQHKCRCIGQDCNPTASPLTRLKSIHSVCSRDSRNTCVTT